MVNAEQLKQLHIGAEWVDALNETFARFNLTTNNQKAMFIGQCSHESGNFRLLQENLNYKAATLMKLWPKRFPTLEVANQYAGNHFHAGKALGVDFVMQPDLVATPKYAALTAGWFWETHKLNPPADALDYTKVTKIINGGTIGLDDRIKHVQHALAVLG